MVKNPPTNAGDVGAIPGSGRYPGGGDGNPLQYSCLENSMDRGAWWATQFMGSQNQTPLRSKQQQQQRAELGSSVDLLCKRTH